MSMTIKQLADSIGVSKTAIRKRIDDSFRDSYTVFNNTGMILISDEGCKLLTDGFRKQVETKEGFAETKEKFPETSGNQAETSANRFSVNDENRISARLVDMLREQLNVKDRQIAELNARLAETTLALTETQRSLQAAQALHVGTIQQSLETTAEQHPYTEADTAASAEGSEKCGFFSRFAGVFNRKR